MRAQNDDDHGVYCVSMTLRHRQVDLERSRALGASTATTTTVATAAAAI